MTSGMRANRNFAAIEAHQGAGGPITKRSRAGGRHRNALSTGKTIDWHEYYLPHMNARQFDRVASLPGMLGYLDRQAVMERPNVPWYLFGNEKY